MDEGSSNFLTSAGFDICNAKFQVTTLTTIRKAASVSLPSEVAFHRSMDYNFAQYLDTFSERVLSPTCFWTWLRQWINPMVKEKLASQDDVVDKFHSLVADLMDQLLEK
jgi:exosome complex exonuclease RRP6